MPLYFPCIDVPISEKHPKLMGISKVGPCTITYLLFILFLIRYKAVPNYNRSMYLQGTITIRWVDNFGLFEKNSTI